MKSMFSPLKPMLIAVKPWVVSYVVTTLVVSSRQLVITCLSAYLFAAAAEAALAFSTATLIHSAVVFFVMLAAFLTVDTLGQYARMRITHRMTNRIKAAVHKSAIGAKMFELDGLGTGRGDILSRINQDVAAAEEIFTYALLSPLISVISGIGAAISVFAVDWRIGGCLIVMGILAFAVQTKISCRQRAVGMRRQKAIAAVMVVFNELLTNRLNIKLSNMITAFQRRMDKDLSHYEQVNLQDSKLQAAQNETLTLASVAQYLCVIVLGLWGMKSGRIGLAEMVFISSLSGLIVMMFTSIGGSIASLQKSLSGAARVSEVLELRLETVGMCSKPLEQTENALETSGLAIEFANGLQVDIGAVVAPAGKITMISGPSGGGKSTIFRVLLGLYDYDGSAAFFGCELRDYSLLERRKAIAYAAQDCFIAKGTIRDNLTLGCTVAPGCAELERALETACCSQWISALPLLLDTPLEERGSRLSGGQRQRLAIARTLLMNKPLVLLDETFSNIDQSTIDIILENIRANYPGKTIIIITHNEEMAKSGDHLVWVTNGN